jgi:RNA recognition motif-containing protein
VLFNTEEEAKDVLAKLTESGLTINGSKVIFEMDRDPSHPLRNEGKRLRTVVVLNVCYESEESEIYDFFSQVGAIERLDLPKQDDRRNKGFVLIMFSPQDEAKAALEKNNQILKGRIIWVQP